MITALLAAVVIAKTPPWPSASVWAFGGSQSCATWLATPDSKESATQWVLGAWSGFNMAFGKMTGSGTDAAGVIGEVEKICRDAPSKRLIDAVRNAYSAMSQSRP